ncbi:TetR family transcriptional regulator [Amycolatopsis thermalba]|uniref:TetR family transcriptional regulator n=1 Tax=Amycolatopsis thermalba TaxID=944492 RepID=A0ABY4P5K8_9PSEU|nr:MULTISPECIES: TetR family transcriptional regulator [Amycolatopsis]UQS27443.1 TetR family transcriptional regulator [Amycolatopsis thermalba]
MTEITDSFAERTRTSLREILLDAAADILAARGYAALRMVDVASAAGVSRQTVYNEFGNKSALVQAVVLRTTGEFLDGIHHRFATAPDLLTGIRDAVTYTIEHGRENRLVASALGTPQGEDLLPLLTTRGEPVLSAAMEVAASHYRESLPALSAEAANLLAETVVRLSLSHLVLPTHTATEAADLICAAIAPAITRYASTMECEQP